MKRKLLLAVLLSAFLLLSLSFAGAQSIENELYLITPVSKDVHDPALKRFAAYAKKKWNIDVKTSAMPKGTPVAYGQILEWKGRPQADVFWGGEGTLFDSLAAEGLLEPMKLPQRCGMRSRRPSGNPWVAAERPEEILGGNHAGAIRPYLSAQAAKTSGS